VSAVIIPFPTAKRQPLRSPSEEELDILFEAACCSPHAQAVVAAAGFGPLIVWRFGSHLDHDEVDRLDAELTERWVQKLPARG
jgi:hypothetical protein